MKYITIFVNECDKLVSSNTKSFVLLNKFIKLASTIATKYPLVFIPTFIEDFMNGVFSKTLVKKYNLHNHNNLAALATICDLKNKRIKDPKSSSLEANLHNPQFKQQYEFLTEYSKILAKPLTNFLNHNILQSIIAHSVIKLTYISYNAMLDSILQFYDELQDEIKILSDPLIRKSFNEYLHDKPTEKIMMIITELAEEQYIIHMDGNISVPRNYTKMNNYLYDIINDSKDGISYSRLTTILFNEYPLLKLIPNNKIFDDLLNKIEQNPQILRKKSFWKYSPSNDQFFTVEIYNKKIEQERIRFVSVGRTKFFGRHITSDQFIDELNMLDLGNLDDLDDQVTRIAGLVLSDAVLLQSPREDMKEFDFIVDIANYNFRPEQEDMMKKLDFQATSNIFHCKVMINDKITKNTLAHLKRVIPTGDQAVIFTCMPVSPEILQQTKDDRTIQIMDEESIRSWCSITPTIPCRRHSIAKVMYGDGRGKIVLVNSLNYESGLAVVETIPDHTETTFYIGCLQEVDLCVSNPEDFELASNTYFDFLCLLGELSFEPLEVCLDVKIHSTHDTRTSFMRKTNPELSDMYLPISGEKKSLKYVELDDVHTRVNMSRTTSEVFVQCECYHKLNEEHHHTLCKHMVASINYLCLDDYTWEGINRKINLVKKKLVKFQEENMTRVIDALYQMSDPESKLLLKSYLQKHVDND